MNAVVNHVPAWIDLLSKNKIPVLRQTARALAQLKQNEAELGAHSITEVVLYHPSHVMSV